MTCGRWRLWLFERERKREREREGGGRGRRDERQGIETTARSPQVNALFSTSRYSFSPAGLRRMTAPPLGVGRAVDVPEGEATVDMVNGAEGKERRN
jgi:hypothetical protein